MHLIAVAIRIHKSKPGFGYRLISDELTEAGHHTCENRVARLCSLQGIFPIHAKKRGGTRRTGLAVYDDLLAYLDEHGRTRHDFTPTSPIQKWLTDISEHLTTWFLAVAATSLLEVVYITGAQISVDGGLLPSKD